MRNLITGATGFVGSHIAERLKKEGEDVVALVRQTSNTKFLESIGIKLVYGDLTNLESVKKAMKGIDKVYHSAAIVGEWISHKEAHQINVEGTKNLLESAKTEKVKQFIYISSLAVLGMKDHHGTPPYDPYLKSHDPYIDTKIDSEKLVLGYHGVYDLPVTVVRPGFIFGPRDPKLLPRILERLKNNKFMFIGDAKNKMNIIYIDNLVDAILLAGRNKRAIGRIYNVTNGSNITIEEFVSKITDLWNLKKPEKHIPKGLAYLACCFLEGFTALVKSKNPPYITKTRVKFLSLNLDFDISKTIEDLGYNPKVSLDEGLKRTKMWLDQRDKAEIAK